MLKVSAPELSPELYNSVYFLMTEKGIDTCQIELDLGPLSLDLGKWDSDLKLEFIKNLNKPWTLCMLQKFRRVGCVECQPGKELENLLKSGVEVSELVLLIPVQVGEGTVIFDIDQVSVVEYDSYDCDEEEPKENIQKSLNSVNKLTIKPEITVPEDAFKDLDTYTINDLLPIFPYLKTIEYHLPPTIPLSILTSPLFQTQTSFFTLESHPSESYIVLRNPKFYYFSPECDYFNFTCNLFMQVKQEIVEEAGGLRKPFQQLFVANLGDPDIIKLTHLEARDSKTLALSETLIVLILNLPEKDT